MLFQPKWLSDIDQAFLTKSSQFFSEFITATLLMFVIFALKDESNRGQLKPPLEMPFHTLTHHFLGAMGKSGAGPFFPLALFFLVAIFHCDTVHRQLTYCEDLRPRRLFWI